MSNRNKKRIKNTEKWQKIAVYVAAVGILVSIVLFLFSRDRKPTKIEIIKMQNVELIKQIRSSFNKDIVSVNSDTIGEIEEIMNFRKATLDLCDLYMLLEKTELVTNDLPSTASASIDAFDEQTKVLKDHFVRLFTSDERIDTIAEKYNIQEYKLFDKSKKQRVKNALIDQLLLLYEAKNQVAKIAAKDKKEMRVDDLEQSLRITQDANNGIVSLTLYNTVFEYAIERNQVLSIRLNKLFANE